MVYRPESDEKLTHLPKVTPEACKYLKDELLRHIRSDIKVVIGENLVPNIDLFPKAGCLESLFKDDEAYMRVSTQSIFGNTPFNEPYCRYDKNTHRNYVCIVPMYVEITEPNDSLNEFIPFSMEAIHKLSRIFDGVSVSLGYGLQKSVVSLFEVDFDCLFHVGKVIGVEKAVYELESNTKIGVMGKEMFVLPFHTLTSFASVYKDTNEDILGRYTNWLRIFRATLSAFDLLEINYKVIEALSAWLTIPISEKDGKQAEKFRGLGGLYEEQLPSNDVVNEDKMVPLEINTFEEASTGIICTFVNYAGNGNIHVAPKIYYPIKHDSEELVEQLQQRIQQDYSNVKINYIELDDTNEKLLIDQLNSSHNKLLINKKG